MRPNYFGKTRKMVKFAELFRHDNGCNIFAVQRIKTILLYCRGAVLGTLCEYQQN